MGTALLCIERSLYRNISSWIILIQVTNYSVTYSMEGKWKGRTLLVVLVQWLQ